MYTHNPLQFLANMSKRRRTDSGFVIQRSAKRPIDKSLVVVNLASTTTQAQTTLKTTTFPCTLTGLRWEMATHNNDTAADQLVRWAIVVIKDGLAATTMGGSDGADFYTPEQDVLAFGVQRLTDQDAANGGPVVANWNGSTKTMRKLKAGDVLAFITLASSATADVDGVIQFFCKS